jgi:hypothetical protein
VEKYVRKNCRSIMKGNGLFHITPSGTFLMICITDQEDVIILVLYMIYNVNNNI